MRDLWIRMGYLGALITLVLIGLLMGRGLGGEVSLTDLAKSGTQVFTIVSYGQVVLVCLLAPLFMASAIAQEQSGKTYDILLTTPLSNLQIVLGSLGGRLFFVWTLLASGLPLFAILLIFGGVPIQSVGISFAVAGLTALMVGTVAVTLSVLRVGGRKAIFTFVISVVAYLFVAYALDVALIRQIAPGPFTTWLTPLHPLLVLNASLDSANYHPPSDEMLAGSSSLVRFYLGHPFETFAILSVSLSAIQVMGCAIVLRRVGQESGPAVRKIKTWLRLDIHGSERQRPARQVTGANPIAWRESHTRGHHIGAILMRWGFAVLAVLLGAGLLVMYHVGALPAVPGPTGQPLPEAAVFRNGLFVLILLEIAVITLVALYMSAGCVSREREDGTLDIFLTTPMTAGQYVWGKLHGLVRFLGFLIAVPVLTLTIVSGYTVLGQIAGWPQATYAQSVFIDNGHTTLNTPLLLAEAPVLLATMLLPFVALCVATGMGWSLKAKGVLGAVIPSVIIILLLSLVLGLCGWSMAQSVPYLGPVVNAFSPMTNMAMVLNPWEHVEGFPAHPIAGRINLAVAAVLAAAGYSLIVWAMLMGMVKSFDQTVRKLSGTG